MAHLLAMLSLTLAAAAPGGGAMQIRSPSFKPNGSIPLKFTCQGEDVSPKLEFGGVPAGAKSLALVVDDPDAPDPAAPKTTWVHWVVYGLPANAEGLPEGAGALPHGARAGLNDWHKPGWGGPCPPVGRHRYFFKLYALDADLGDLKQPTKAALEQAMEGHILAKAELVGTYQKE
jgi:Raf kinase inhibitor-like YbhB/YbcL family protein